MVKTQTRGFGFSVRASMAQPGLNAVTAVAFYPERGMKSLAKRRLKMLSEDMGFHPRAFVTQGGG